MEQHHWKRWNCVWERNRVNEVRIEQSRVLFFPVVLIRLIMRLCCETSAQNGLKWTVERVADDHGNALFFALQFLQANENKEMTRERREKKVLCTLHVVHRLYRLFGQLNKNAPLQHLHRFHLSTFKRFLPIHHGAMSEWVCIGCFFDFRSFCASVLKHWFNTFQPLFTLCACVCSCTNNELQQCSACKAYVEKYRIDSNERKAYKSISFIFFSHFSLPLLFPLFWNQWNDTNSHIQWAHRKFVTK